MKLIEAEVLQVELPFRKPFRHAASTRRSSSSVFLKLKAEDGTLGYGECLPRDYVTGETQDGVAQTLLRDILPSLLGFSFGSLEEIIAFLKNANGSSPFVRPQRGEKATCAWSAVDLALLDTYGRIFGRPVRLGSGLSSGVRYSAALSADSPRSMLKTLITARLLGMKQIKLKAKGRLNERTLRMARFMLGGRARLRVDANMGWSVEQAKSQLEILRRFGVEALEQPLDPDDIRGLSQLTGKGVSIIADESFSDGESLRTLIRTRACDGVNIRISKCGGLVAAARRAEEALAAGLSVQIGCQVGESSLLSAANLILLSSVSTVDYAEGCFGRHLLKSDPVYPNLQFGYGGKPPRLPNSPGLGVSVNEAMLSRFVKRRYSLTLESIVKTASGEGRST